MKHTYIIVSACLIGTCCRYDGKCKEVISEPYGDGYTLIPVCPEQLGGLATPRAPAEIVDERVVNRNGDDVTQAYKRGAEEALVIAKKYGCRYAILKERSPSCGSREIYDGSFSGTLKDGNGITAELFLKNGIKVVGESDAKELLQRLK